MLLACGWHCVSGVSLRAQSSWIVVTPAGTPARIEFDTTSLRAVPGGVVGRFRWTGNLPTAAVGGAPVATMQRDAIADCVSGKVALEGVRYLDAAGGVLDGTTWDETEWEFVAPPGRSYAAIERDALCRVANAKHLGAERRPPTSPARPPHNGGW